MADIRINQLPVGGGPVATDFVPLDNGSTRKATIQQVVEIGRPAASQAEAEAGTNPTKVMTPLTTKQAVTSYGLLKANNLNDLADAAASRTNLGLGTAATQPSTAFATSAQGTLADGSAQKSANLSDLASAAVARENLDLGLPGTSSNLLIWGNSLGATWDGVSDFQAIFSQTQPTFLPNGSLGALYVQRINSYAGGATSDSVTPACAAVRGYNQIQDTVTYCNESAGLFVNGNYSWLGQSVGVFGQANSYHGGRTFGLEAEAIEHPESYTPTNGTTVLVVPNNFVAGSEVVVKNGTVLTSGVGYNVSAKPASDQTGTISSISGTGSVVTVAFSGGFTPPVNYYVDIAGVTPNVYNGRWKVLTSSAGNATLSAPGSGTMTVAGTLQVQTALAGSVTLTTPANGTDTFKVIRGDPEFAASGGEVLVYAAGGTDNRNTLSGNRVGLSIFGWRSTTEAITTKIGTLLNLVSNPSDASLTVDRGVNFQGKFVTGIDFTAANATFSSFMMKFNGSGAGLSASGSLLRLGDSTHIGRMQVSTGSGAVFGSDTAIDVLLTRNGTERVRVGAGAVQISNGTSGGLLLATDGTATGRMQASVGSGVIFGSDTAHDVITTRGGTEVARQSSDGPHQRLTASATPNVNGELVIQATSNTSLTFKYRGSDGVTRSNSLTLA